MKIDKKYDYIICGGGASGLLLSYSILSDEYFKNKKVLLVEKDEKKINNKTFCFWDDKKTILDKIVEKEWSHAEFIDESYNSSFNLLPYKYKMIRSDKLYTFLKNKIDKASNFEYLNAEISNISNNQNLNFIETSKGIFESQIIFSSIYNPKEYSFKKFPLIKQHFLGWVIETNDIEFEDNKFRFMDFSVKQHNEIRFMYVLPYSKTKALYEYTFFGGEVLKDKDYEKEIKSYLKDQGINSYKILEKEKGIIPMTCYPFFKRNTDNFLSIGTAGGWTKPSTGYTIKNSLEKIEIILDTLKKDKPLSKIKFRNRFWYYDILFLDVLINSKGKGSKVFSDLFKNNDPILLFKFLGQKTSLIEELRIFVSVNVILFVRSLFARVKSVYLKEYLKN